MPRKGSRSRCRQGLANALGEILRVPGGLRGLVDVRTPAQFFKRQALIQDAGAIEIAIAPAGQDMADIKSADPAGEVCIAHDIDRAVVAEQMVKLGSIRKLVDSFQVDQEQPARKLGRYTDAVKKDILFTVIGANPHQIALIPDNIDQLKLPEERGDGLETFPDFPPGFDGYAEGRSVIEA